MMLSGCCLNSVVRAKVYACLRSGLRSCCFSSSPCEFSDCVYIDKKFMFWRFLPGRRPTNCFFPPSIECPRVSETFSFNVHTNYQSHNTKYPSQEYLALPLLFPGSRGLVALKAGVFVCVSTFCMFIRLSIQNSMAAFSPLRHIW